MGERLPCSAAPRTPPHGRLRRLLCALGCLGAAIVQADPGAVADVRFRSWSTEDGLSQVSAIDLLPDREGFLWIATQDGLNRFDGHRFQIWRHDGGDPQTLSDNYVLALTQSADGAIWAGTQNGLNRLDPLSGRVERFPAGGTGLRDGLVNGVLAAADGGVYVSTRRGGVQRFDPATRSFSSIAALPNVVSRQKLLGVQADGQLLVSVEDELWRVDAAGQDHQVLLAAGVLKSGSFVIAATPLPDGGYALGSRDSGVLLLAADGHIRRWLRQADGLPDDGIRSLHADAAGRLWIGTTQGLARLEADGQVNAWWHRPGERQALPSDRVVALRGDSRGLLWIGTWTGGFSRFDPETEAFRVQGRGLPEPFGLPANATTAISAAADGGLWLGQVDRGGAIELDSAGRVLRRLGRDSEPAIVSEDVVGIYAEPAGVWIGHLRGGVDFIGRDGSTRSIPVGIGNRALPDASVQSILRSRDGTLWLGLLGGGTYSLCTDCADLRHWPADEQGKAGPLGTSINAILETRDGRLWFAVRRSGLSWFDPRKSSWGALTGSAGVGPALPHESVTCLHEDARGQLWIGSQGGGISRIERGADGEPSGIESWSEAQGLASSMVGAILESADGRLWISTTRGLCGFAPADRRFDCLGERDPALAGDFFVASAARDAAGGLHFGGSRGLVSIRDPARVAFPSRDATVLLTELRIANRPVRPGDADAPLQGTIETAERIELRHDQDLVAIEFAALDLRRMASLRYRYRLLGRDTGWIETDASRRVATWTDLPSGSYRFEVEALDGGSVVGRRALGVHVSPPPWLGPWARAGYLLLLLAACGFWWWRYRHRLHENEKAQDALAQSEAMLKQALWGSRGELWDADVRSGRLSRRDRLEHLEVNRRAAAETLEAYTPFVHEEDRPRFRDAMLACVKGESDLFECTYRSTDTDGQWRWLLSRGRVFSRDAQGRAQRMVGTTFDITDLRATEEAVRSSKDRLNLALWGSGDEMWDIDLTSGRIRRENPLPSVKLSAEVLVPHLADYMDQVHPADQGRLREALVAHLKGLVDHFECSYRTIGSAGGWVWLFGKGRVLVRDSAGRALRMVGTNRDITQLKRVEDELRELNEELESRVIVRTEALERANSELKGTLGKLTRAQRQLVESEKLAALGGLVAGVAHEINTPLGVSVTAASHLHHETQRLVRALGEGRTTRGDLDHYIEQALQSSDLVLRNLDRASALVRSFKQVAVDQSSEQRRQFRLRDYLSEVLLSLHPRIKAQRAEVVIDGDGDLELDTYPGALYQIIVNLVINALTHAFGEQQGGRIEIEVAAEGEDAVIEFRDNGKGMSEAVQKRVFEPFFTTRRGTGGSGLGLHIVYNLATQVLLGSVCCESAPGRGTRFRVQFPRITPLRARAPDEEGA